MYQEWYLETVDTAAFNVLSADGKKDLISKSKQDIKEQVFEKYRFKYKKEGKTQSTKQEEKMIKKLLP